MKLEFLNSQEASDKRLNVYQTYAYSRYALPDTLPEIEIQESHDGSIVRYITLWTDAPIKKKDLNPESPHKKYAQELQEFSNLLGFMSLEIGSFTEANLLTNKPHWPGVYAYGGDLAIHGFLPKDKREEVQKRLWEVAFSVIGIIPVFILTINKIITFAETSGHIFTLDKDAKLNRESDEVKDYTQKWPGYWKNDPALYKVKKGS